MLPRGPPLVSKPKRRAAGRPARALTKAQTHCPARARGPSPQSAAMAEAPAPAAWKAGFLDDKTKKRLGDAKGKSTG